MRMIIFIINILFIFLFIKTSESKRSKVDKYDLRNKETNAPNFVRLLVMRLIFGIASSMGFGDRVAEFMGGILVPPGVEDYDDYGSDDYGFGASNIFEE